MLGKSVPEEYRTEITYPETIEEDFKYVNPDFKIDKASQIINFGNDKVYKYYGSLKTGGYNKKVWIKTEPSGKYIEVKEFKEDGTKMFVIIDVKTGQEILREPQKKN